jgi:hypothetical protein
MVYAIIGIPLLLLFLTNIGDVLAKTFKWLYSRSVKLKMRIVLWQKRRKQAKLRHATNLVTRMSRNNAPPNNSSRHPNNNMHDPQQQAYFSTVPDFEELIAAREELAKLEAKLQVCARVHTSRAHEAVCAGGRTVAKCHRTPFAGDVHHDWLPGVWERAILLVGKMDGHRRLLLLLGVTGNDR